MATHIRVYNFTFSFHCLSVVSRYGPPPIASDVVDQASVCTHVEVAGVSRMELHTKYLDR